MSQTQKQVQYAAMLSGKIAEIFNEESEFYINPEELNEGENLTHFFHALATMMPNRIYNQITGEHKNNLEFNHLANQLVFQYSTKEKED